MTRPLRHVLRNGVLLIVLTCGAAFVAPGQTTNPKGEISQPQPKPADLNPDINRPPDANRIAQMREQQARKKNFEAANTERKRQLSEDSALLLKLAEELRTEMESNTGATLSPTQVRKVEDIERLARNVQQKMKLTIGAS
jgi:hypothetical protein